MYAEHKEGRAKKRILGDFSIQDVCKRKSVKDSEKEQAGKEDE